MTVITFNISYPFQFRGKIYGWKLRGFRVGFDHDVIFRAIFRLFLREDRRRATAFAFYHVPSVSVRFKANRGLLYKCNSAVVNRARTRFHAHKLRILSAFYPARSFVISVSQISRPFLVPATMMLLDEWPLCPFASGRLLFFFSLQSY